MPVAQNRSRFRVTGMETLMRVGQKWSRFWQNDTHGSKELQPAMAFHVEKAEFVLP